MALDVHILGTVDEKPTTLPACSIDDVVHAELFALREVRPATTRYLWRMHDYYADAFYSPAEVDRLSVDVRSVLPRLSQSAAGVMATLLKTCERAGLEQKCLVCFCD